MQLHEQNSDRVHAIALNVDFDEEGEPSAELRQQVTSILKSQGVTCETVLASDPYEEVIGKFDVFSLPAALVFNAEGKLLRTFDGMVDYEKDVIPLIQKELE